MLWWTYISHCFGSNLPLIRAAKNTGNVSVQYTHATMETTNIYIVRAGTTPQLLLLAALTPGELITYTRTLGDWHLEVWYIPQLCHAFRCLPDVQSGCVAVLSGVQH